MPAPDLSRIQGLARPSEQERTEYAAFLAALRTLLRDPWIRHAGRSLPLADYLDAVRPAPVSGDEQDVVDRLSLRLLASLGYSEADLAYNRRLPVDTRAVPDITVRLSEIPASLPVFVVEDKATDIRDFLRPRPGADGQRETPYEQLRRYVQGGGVQGRQGLLCNGFVLEAWEFGPGGGMRLVSLDLAALGRDALDGPWPGAQDKALRVVFDRFSKFAFLQTWDLAGRHFIKPKPSAEWLARMQAALAEGPDAFRDVVALFHLDNWKARAADAFAHADTLVDALKDLIALFEDDVHQQVLDALARATGYSAARRELVQGSRVGALRERVWALRGAFPEDEFQGLLMDPLDEWCAEPRIEDLQRLAQEWIAPLDPLFRTAVGKAGHQPDAFDGKDVIEDVGRTAAARKRFRLDALAAAIRDLCKAALDEHVERQRLDAAGGTAQQARIAFEAWKSRVDKTVFVGAEPDELVREYARQTAYVYIVRLLLVRICEDKGLFQRKLSDGGLLEWQDQARRYLDFASGRSYEYLTQMAYECAQNVYAHFFGASQPFDWYRMDEKVLVRALLVLDAFNLAQIDEDIIGTVYGRFLTEGKHEQGRYYTSTDLVHLMLDRAGWTPGATVGRRLADISCGSGSFLVEGARRILASFRGPDGRIPDSSVERALYEVQRGVVGLDLNPFACYLAETNLLIQVLDLVHQAWDCGIRVSVDRFHVYCTDSLIVDEVAGAVADGSAAILLGRDEVEAELIKSRTGPYRDGFDVIVGNPPYVRADEAAPRWVDYRHRVEAQAWFTTAHQKWDLYVPFVEQNRRLLSDAPGARCCLVTIESIKTSPYVAKLHELLGRQSTVYDIVFTERLKLFPDAKWQDNVVFTFGRGQPTPDTVTTREICRQRGPGGTLRLVPMDEVRQAETEPDRLFNPTTAVELDRSDTVAWEEICYVSKGMVLHSSERLADGEVVAVPAAYDPSNFGEELVEDLGKAGKRIRHRPFTRDSLLGTGLDEIHTRPTVESEDVLRGGIGSIHWLEYGAHTRCPARVSRPTFPHLFEAPKVMFGKFTGIAVDDGTPHGFLLAPDGVRVAVRWCHLAGIDNRQLRDARDALARSGRWDPALSESLSEWYLCALALSAPLQEWLHANRRSMKEDVYPDDIKAIPVKLLPPEAQAPFIERARERHRLWAELTVMAQQGFRITPANVEIPILALLEQYLAGHPIPRPIQLYQAPATRLFWVNEPWLTRDLARVRAVGDAVKVRGDVVAEVGAAVPASQRERFAQVLARVLAALPSTFADQGELTRVPADVDGWLALGDFLDAARQGVRDRQARIKAIGREIDDLARALYNGPAHPSPAPRPVRGVREPTGPLL